MTPQSIVEDLIKVCESCEVPYSGFREMTIPLDRTGLGVMYSWECPCTRWGHLADFDDPNQAKGKTERLRDLDRIRRVEAHQKRIARAKAEITKQVKEHRCSERR